MSEGLEWEERQPEDMMDELSYICIDDGYYKHCAYLGHMTYEEAIKDYTQSYDFGDEETTDRKVKLHIVVHLVLEDEIADEISEKIKEVNKNE